MSDVVICEPIRTPVGRFGGALASLSAADLASAALTELVRRTGLGEGDVDDVVLGQCYPNGETPPIGRIAALDAGLGPGCPGVQVDRRCGSGLQAVLYAAGRSRPARPRGRRRRRRVDVAGRALRARAAHRCPRGGVELMDRLARARETAGGRDHPVPGGMIETAENLRREYAIGREEQDEFAAVPTSGPSPPRRRPVRRRVRPGHRPRPARRARRRRRPRRAPAPGHHPRGAGRPAAGPPAARPGLHRHRRQRQRPERRRRHVRRHHPRRGRAARAAPAARPAVVGGGRRRPGGDGHRPRRPPPPPRSTGPASPSTTST